MKRLAFLILLLSVALAPAQTIDKSDGASVGSLWSDAVPNPLVDRTARKIGDLVTIVISESSVSTFKAGTNASKSDANNVAQKLFIGFLDRIFKPFATSANSNNKGEGDTKGGDQPHGQELHALVGQDAGAAEEVRPALGERALVSEHADGKALFPGK